MADMHFKDTVTKRATTKEKAGVRVSKKALRRGEKTGGPSRYRKKMKVCFTFTAALRAINF